MGMFNISWSILIILLICHRPFSVQSVNKAKLAEDGKESTTNRRMMLENGHPGVEVDEAAIRRGENPYTKYFQQQGENPAAAAVAANGQVSRLTPEASAMRI
jgi:pre-mRNA-processing factor 39